MRNRFLRTLINMIMPTACPSCGSAECAYPLPVCESCEQEVLSSSSWSFTSGDDLDGIWSLRKYKKAMRICLKELKYRRNLNVLPLLRDIAAELQTPGYKWSERFQLLIPVPGGTNTGKKTRGAHSLILSRLLSEMTGVPSASDILVKDRTTRKQARLSRDERLFNLSGAFRVTDPLIVRERSVILTDDIITTGATVTECAKTLLRAGAARVIGLTFAKSV